LNAIAAIDLNKAPSFRNMHRFAHRLANAPSPVLQRMLSKQLLPSLTGLQHTRGMAKKRTPKTVPDPAAGESACQALFWSCNSSLL
jgi:hypothetical protein